MGLPRILHMYVCMHLFTRDLQTLFFAICHDRSFIVRSLKVPEVSERQRLRFRPHAPELRHGAYNKSLLRLDTELTKDCHCRGVILQMDQHATVL